MKLSNYTLLSMSVILPFIISIWAFVFYIELLDEVRDSIDDGLENYKMLIIYEAARDTSILQKTQFRESNYAIRKVSADHALRMRETYRDTLLYSQYEQEKEPYRLLTTSFLASDSQYYELNIASSMVEEDDLTEDLLYSLLWLYLVLLAVILLLNNFLLKRIWAPFYQLLDQLKRFRLGSSKPFIPPTTRVEEFRDMNETVAALLQRNQDTFNSQKQFIENAAHELQTPVAISINKLELMAEQPEMTETHTHALGQVIQILERLNRLNKSLLLLSKIENRQFMEEETIHFNDILRDVVEAFNDFAQYKNIAVEYRESSRADFQMNKELARTLVSNLIKNAIVHNLPDGKVKIHVAASYFSIENTGSEVPLDEDKMFSRFYKNSAQKNTTGLGLAIVKAIAGLYGFKVEYTFSGTHQIKIIFQP